MEILEFKETEEMNEIYSLYSEKGQRKIKGGKSRNYGGPEK